MQLNMESGIDFAMDNRKQLLIAALQDTDEQVRKLAADALEKIETRDRLYVLEKKIDRGEMIDKIRAVYALGDLKGAAIIEILKKAAKDPSEDVRSAAVRVMGSTGDIGVLASLVESLKDQSVMVARTAVEAIAKFKDPRLLGPLMLALKHEDTGVVERALDAVGGIGDKRAEEAMLYFAVKGNPRMRGLALKALGTMDR